MEEKVEVAPSNSRRSPDADALYCEECLRVDRSFNDIPNTAARQNNQCVLDLTLRADRADIEPNTTCPSCRDIVNILDEVGPDARYLRLVIEGFFRREPHRKEIWSASDHISNTTSNPYHYSYLLRRSDCHMRLRNDSTTYTKAKDPPVVLIKSWLHTCEREHEGWRSDPANELAMSLYLIDVVEECITLKPVLNVRYIALSYV